MENVFKPGDRVQLKSGGPPMTVKFDDKVMGLCCEWWDGKKFLDRYFIAETLKLAPNGPMISVVTKLP